MCAILLYFYGLTTCTQPFLDRFAVLYTQIIRHVSLFDYPSASEETLLDMGKMDKCRTTTKYNKARTVCIIVFKDIVHDSIDVGG